MSLTDHDSTEGIAEAKQRLPEQTASTLIPGVESRTDIPGDEVHVLGHFLDVDDPELQAFLKGNRVTAASTAAGAWSEALNKMGVAISWERVQQIAGEAAIGRPHVAQALVEAGHVETVSEAFERYIGRNGPAYADRVKLTPRQAVEFVVKVGGVATFAHPTFTSQRARGPARPRRRRPQRH